MSDWKDTLNLPRTDFPMKANLPTSEPATLARWAQMDLYGRIRKAREGRPMTRIRVVGKGRRNVIIPWFCPSSAP